LLKHESPLAWVLLGAGAWFLFGDDLRALFARLSPSELPHAPTVKPSAVPAGLPQFPDGWEPDLPLPSAVISRAAALRFALWGQGEGATTTEQVDGRWITFQAQYHGSKKGVGAFRLKGTAQGATG